MMALPGKYNPDLVGTFSFQRFELEVEASGDPIRTKPFTLPDGAMAVWYSRGVRPVYPNATLQGLAPSAGIREFRGAADASGPVVALVLVHPGFRLLRKRPHDEM